MNIHFKALRFTLALAWSLQPAVTLAQDDDVEEDEDTSGGDGEPKQFNTGIEYKRTSPRARVTFNLEDAELKDLVKVISGMTGRRFILPTKLRSIKATIFAPSKVTVAEAYRAFLSILRINGMTVVRDGRYLRIIDTKGVETENTPISRNGRIPNDARYITRLEKLTDVTATDAAELLTRFKTEEGSVTAYAPTNTVIITDTGTSIRRMLQVLRAVDVPSTGEQIWIEPVHYATASELASRLQEIFPVGDGESSGGQGKPRPKPNTPNNAGSSEPGSVGDGKGVSIKKILADERTNSLIILASERGYMRLLEMIRQLDVPLEGEGRIHVHPIQYGDAEQISSTLSNLISGSGPSGGGRGNRGNRAANNNNASSGSTDIFEGQIRVTAHPSANSLVITSSLHDYAALKRVIGRLDSPRRQVFIEAVIMELSVNRTRSLGIGFHSGIPDFPSDGSIGLFGKNAVQSLAAPVGALSNQEALTGLALGVRGPDIEESQQLGLSFTVPAFGVVLNAFANTTDANILSTPHIMAMDNEEAEISVGQNVPLQTSGFGAGNLGALAGAGGANNQAAGGLTGLAGLAGLAGGFGAAPRQDVGTTLRVTPHINENNQVRLEIEQEISSAQEEVEGSLGVRSLNRRTAKTQMMVNDQQTVVIGGLMSDEIQKAEQKIPILGDIPLIGILFRNTRTVKRKNNLLLFLTPYIVRDGADLRHIFERKMRERQDFLDRYLLFSDTEYEPPIDYSRTRGLVAEIFSEMRDLEEERRLRLAIEGQGPLGHDPKPPVGSAKPDDDEGQTQAKNSDGTPPTSTADEDQDGPQPEPPPLLEPSTGDDK